MTDWTRYDALRVRPEGPVAMRQTWHDLLFLHGRIPVEVLAKFLPAELEIDTFEGDAWVGLVPFHMSGIRPPNLPAAPWLSKFPETNVRTYVVYKGQPGVWFFSLDAARWLACWYARQFFALPYYHARMSVVKNSDSIVYRGQRAGASYEISAPLPLAFEEAQPATLEFWFVERYLLFAQSKRGIFKGQVAHSPYKIGLIPAADVRIRQNLIEACGLPDVEFEHACFSPGVSVDVFGLERA